MDKQKTNTSFKNTINTKKKMTAQETVAKAIFALAAVFAILSVVSIIIYLLIAGIPALKEIGIFNFLFGTTWSPSYDGPASEKFGILQIGRAHV